MIILKYWYVLTESDPIDFVCSDQSWDHGRDMNIRFLIIKQKWVLMMLTDPTHAPSVALPNSASVQI